MKRPHADRVLLIQALLLVAGVRLGLWTIPFRYLRRLAQKTATLRGADAVPDPANIRRIGWAVSRASRRVPGASCLTQALAARILLAWHGLDGDLNIGVAKNREFAAHAWVTSQGQVVVGGAESHQFQPLLVWGRERL